MEKIYFEEKGNAFTLKFKIRAFESVGIVEAMAEPGVYEVYIAGVCDSFFKKDCLGAWQIIDGIQLIPVAVEGIGKAIDNTFN